MLRTPIIAAALAIGAAATPAFGQSITIPPGATVAYVSASRLTAETADGRSGQARLQTFQQQKAAELRTRQEALEETRRKLAQATEPADRSRLQQQESVQRADLERATAQANADVQATQRDVLREFHGKVRAVLDELVKGTSIQVVLQAETAILWAAPGVDVTTAVVERLNKAAASDAR